MALPPENLATEFAQFQIRPGGWLFEGRVAPNFDLPGGGLQYYLPNLSDLTRIQ
jgi:hypothetical protein